MGNIERLQARVTELEIALASSDAIRASLVEASTTVSESMVKALDEIIELTKVVAAAKRWRASLGAEHVSVDDHIQRGAALKDAVDAQIRREGARS